MIMQVIMTAVSGIFPLAIRGTEGRDWDLSYMSYFQGHVTDVGHSLAFVAQSQYRNDPSSSCFYLIES